jgi:hypothetical protein
VCSRASLQMWKACEEPSMLPNDTSKRPDSKEEMAAPSVCPHGDSP